MQNNLEQLHRTVTPIREQLLRHPLYEHLTNIDSLRFFMEHHVFAVWDFMSLLKAMQSHFCGTTVPWTPTSNVLIARMIHEIVLEEETDSDGENGYASHFELYLRSMQQCGADTNRIDKFLNLIRAGIDLDAALEQVNAPDAVRSFVRFTFSVIRTGDPVQIVSAFTFGRENLLPEVFNQIVERIDQQSSGELSMLRYYLERHIGLDGDVHGPLAERLVCQLCGDDSELWTRAQSAALKALEHRLNLWDGMVQCLLSNDRKITLSSN